jgi:hypothetical protein
MRHIFFYFCLILVTFSCKTPAEPVKTRSLECYVRILETEGEVLAEATMKASDPSTGQIKPIEVSGGVRFQGSPMDIRPVQGLSYHTEYKGVYQASNIFSWDDEKKVRHTFEADMNAIKNFRFEAEPVSLSSPARFVWEGEPLQTGESMVFMWENEKEHLAIPMEIVGAGGKPEIQFPAAKLAELQPGDWSLYVVRKRLVKTKIDGTECQAVLEFYSATKQIRVIR